MINFCENLKCEKALFSRQCKIQLAPTSKKTAHLFETKKEVIDLFRLGVLLPHYRSCDIILLRIPAFKFSNSRVHMYE